jgi:HAD superfamily hydrolase (TIGR01549 family)
MIRHGKFYNISGIAIAMAREQGVPKDEEVRARFLERLDIAMDRTGPGQDMPIVLDQLQKKGVLMGIVTFQRRPRLEHRLEKWKLKSYFKAVVTPEQHFEFKPSPVPFLAAIKQLKIPADHCFVVGDEPADMMGGKKAGAETVGLPQGFFSADELKQTGADQIINSLVQLPPLIQ